MSKIKNDDITSKSETSLRWKNPSLSPSSLMNYLDAISLVDEVEYCGLGKSRLADMIEKDNPMRYANIFYEGQPRDWKAPLGSIPPSLQTLYLYSY